MNQIEKLSEFILNLELDRVPKEVVNASKYCVLDSFGAAVGASKDQLIIDIVNEYIKLYPSQGDADVWGFNHQLPFIQAAFLNALMGHRLELDDVHTKSKTHIGTVVVPTAIALAQHLKSSGKEFLEAVICGYEVMSRIGMAFGVSSHRNKGWHVTSTAGTFGAAAAAAKLMTLNYEQTVYALGMAGTQSFGVWAFLGDSASSKILHPARAAVSGIEAAILAKSGMTGPSRILDASDGGLFQAMSDDYDLSQVSNNLGLKYEILNVDNKPYPCCRSTHCAIDSALYLKDKHAIDNDLIEKIEVDTYLVGYKQCGTTEGSINPVTPTDAKFSTPYTIAEILVHGKITLDSFKTESIKNPKVQELLKKITVKPNGTFTERYPDHWGCKTKIIMKDGTVLEVEIKDALGSVANPITEKDIKNKVEPLLAVAYKDATTITDILLSIDKVESFSQISFNNNGV
ncbi:MAG: MmgE/PrpD family protein [Eubacteriales bacterium]|nr:MmgE/PrpD family protein [Eubacteriales bacterium]